jgi:assimilatory nitrate reductase catalytic subunit
MAPRKPPPGSGCSRGGRILVRSRRAELVADACIVPTVQPGQVFIPMHYREVNPS